MNTKPKDQKCENCKYWHPHDQDDETGICRRFPPVPVVRVAKNSVGVRQDFITQGWPEVWRGAWCGEWKAK